MTVPASSHTHVELLDSQKAALVKLLSDEDNAVYRMVREKIVSLGSAALEWLRPQVLSNDPVLRQRAREIVTYLARQQADNHFLGFCLSQGEEFDIEEATFLLAQSQYPDLNPAGYSALLDSYASDLRNSIGSGGTAEGIVSLINQYFFGKLRFTGNDQNYYDPENSYLNRVIDRRTGNPISLCAVYLFIAKRLCLPVVGIGMPGHFLLRYQSSTEEIYIDAFNQGRLLSKAKCMKFLVQTGGFQDTYLAPVSSRRVLLRICSNLHQIYSQLEAADEIARFQRYIVALAK